MDNAAFIEQFESHATALRSAAVAVGPQARVPTCPEWTVQQLVAHNARLHAWVLDIYAAADPTERPPFPKPPQDWDELLDWWEDRFGSLRDAFRTVDPDLPVWAFPTVPNPTAAVWMRRQAHEIAIHRLDGEAAAGIEPGIVFTPEFAADGVRELSTVLWPLLEWTPTEGSVAFRATDADLHLVATLRSGGSPLVGPAEGTADATIEGPADALYRFVWGRPNAAVTSGDRDVLAGLKTV